MKNEMPIYSKHIFCLSLLFTLAGGILSAPFNADSQHTIYAFLISAVFGCLVYFLTAKYLTKYKVFLFVAVLVSFICAVNCAVDFCVFIKNSLLSEMSVFLVAAVFLALIIYVVLKDYAALLKFSLIAAFFTLVLIIFFLIATAENFKISNVLPAKGGDILAPLYTYFKKIVLPMLVLPFFVRVYFEKPIKRYSFFGVITGYGILFLTIINSLLVFGGKFAQRVLYPYAAAVSTVTFGSFFTRLDGFAYIIYFSAVIIRTATCVLVIKKLFVFLTFRQNNCILDI